MSHTDYEKMARDLTDEASRVGAAWASYGLKVGEAALEAGAETLRRTAEVLNKLAESLRAAPGAPVPPEAPSPTDEPAAPQA
jgi:hypothetical protein